MSGSRKIISYCMVMCMILLSVITVNFKAISVNAAGENDSWGPLAGTDDLGRTLVDYSTVGQPKSDRAVGVFYLVWHGTNDMRDYKNIVNFDEALSINPNSPQDYDSPLWPDANHFGYWDKPLFGYYRTDDAWVMRKHMQLLGEAGVDFIYVDMSNFETYTSNVELLMRIIEDIQRQGCKTPKIVFMTHNGIPGAMDKMYDTFYAPDAPYRHPSTWYYMNGKPMIMGEDPSGNVSSFFTFKHTQWPNETKDNHDGWDWISFDRPQRMNYTNVLTGSVIDERNSSVSYTGTWTQSSPSDAYSSTEKYSSTANNGVSYTFTGTGIAWVGPRQPGAGKGNVWVDGNLLGYNIDLSAAVRAPKQLLFSVSGLTSSSHTITVGVSTGTVTIDGFAAVTSVKDQMAVSTAQNSGETAWFSRTDYYNADNPAARSRSYHNGAEDISLGAVNYGYNFQEEWDYAISQDPPTIMVDGWNEWIAGNWQDVARTGPLMICDVTSINFNRDIEPMTGGYGDNYYMQLVNNIRRYKGVEVPAAPSACSTITINTDFSQWTSVGPAFKDYTEDTAARNTPGVHNDVYKNTTGRNDIDVMKITRDATNIYFYVKTVNDMTSYTNAKWMTLYLNIDGNGTNGWKGYDYIVNRTTPGSATTCTLESSTGGWNFTTVATNISYSVSGNQMMVKIPRSSLGSLTDPLNIQFKWADNWQNNNSIDDFYQYGDAAPDGRFNFVYKTSELPTPVATPTTGTTPAPSPALKPSGYYKIEDNDKLIESYGYNAAWVTANDSGSSGGTYEYLSNPNGSTNTHAYFRNDIRTEFTGNGVKWITRKAPDGTEAEIFIDGLSQGKVSLYNATIQKQVVAFEKYGLGEGNHEIMVVFAFQNGTYYHDAFEYRVGSANITAVSGENLARKAFATATSFAVGRYAPYNSGMANDGDDSTYWCADGATMPQALTVDMGQSRQFANIKTKFFSSALWKYRIEGSTDNANWMTLIDKTTSGVTARDTSDTVSGSYRYVKITITACPTSWAAISEFEIYEVTPPLMLSQGKTVTTSAQVTGYEGAKAVDGNNATYWCPPDGTMPQWLNVDLAQDRQLNNIEIKFYINALWKYKIEGSTNNSTWITLIDKTTTGVTAQDVIDFTSGNYRYVKITITACPTSWAAIREFKVYGT